MTAMDEDEDENAQVSYSIRSGAEGAFEIDEQSGVIRLKSPLNSARKAQYKLKIAAKDKGDRKAVEDAVVEILVEQSASAGVGNLELGQGGYHFVVVEDAGKKEPAVGREVGRIVANNNNNLKYSIVDGDRFKVFHMDENTGLLTTAKRVDREKQSHYQLTVVARSGFAYGTVQVNVTVHDVNDNPPRFDKSRAVARVVENWPAGHEIYLAQAEDLDTDNNSRITYSLSLNPHDLFTISPSLGMIYLARPLMKEEERSVYFDSNNSNQMTVEVTATDGGSPPLSSRQLVTLTLEDVNDHTSVFEYSSYETSLLETISGISSFLFRPFLNRNLFVVFLLCPNKFSEKFFALSATEGRVSDSISEGNNPPAEVRNLSRRDALRQESSTRQGISKIITP